MSAESVGPSGLLPLYVEYCGEESEVHPGASFSFGRNADLSIDENQYLHRRLGLFDAADGMWWIHNVGSSVVIEIVDVNSPSRIAVESGSVQALVFEECNLRFRAGPTTYEVKLEVPLARPIVDAKEALDGTPTVVGGRVDLTNDQLLCILALAEVRLRNPSAGVSEIPTNRSAAARLGWRITRFNRKLDNVCDKLERAGVPGLRGSAGTLATRRRELLVDHSLVSGLISAEELPLLDVPGASPKT